MSAFQEKRIRKLQERERKLLNKLAASQAMREKYAREPWSRGFSEMDYRELRSRAADCAMAMNEMGLNSELEWAIASVMEEIHES